MKKIEDFKFLFYIWPRERKGRIHQMFFWCAFPIQFTSPERFLSQIEFLYHFFFSGELSLSLSLLALRSFIGSSSWEGENKINSPSSFIIIFFSAMNPANSFPFL